jgi:hypothetical protein
MSVAAKYDVPSSSASPDHQLFCPPREIVELSFSRWHPKEKDQLDALAYFLLFLGGIAFILLVPARIPSVYG